ncbi:putative V type ATPase family [Trypanosoma vivax]|nr:vacuolar proton translocating ATPase subunit A [Trypanosoma vivax]KAH8613605.1 putative V type ATPase family [Trypanosoma vivax]
MPLEAASGLWRSEDMTLLRLTMQRETVHDSVLKLGQLSAFQFLDLNSSTSAFQRDFVQEVRRCDDMERKLRYLHEEIETAGITCFPDEPSEQETLFSLEHKVDQYENELREMNGQYQSLIEERNRSREHLEVLNREFGSGIRHSQGLNLLTGVIPKDRVPTLERLVYRITRGNSVIQTDRITTPLTDADGGQGVEKCVFGIYFAAPRLRESLQKISEVNGASLYLYAENGERLREMRESLNSQLETMSHTLHQSKARQQQMLTSIAGSVYEWRRFVAVERAVYSTMNMLRFSGSAAIAEGWAPVRSLPRIRAALQEAEYLSGAQVLTIVEELLTKDKPPTHFFTNKFTACFQGIVDSYGMARYKEINPGVLTIVTFPYLFGVMYGDIGHGAILTLFSIFLISMEKHWEKKKLNEIFAMIFDGRYLLFLMGLFAVYLGLLYNDLFGFSTEIFASGYQWEKITNKTSGNMYPINMKDVTPNRSVIFGIDSAWSETENKLEFYNSVKMKCSVIIGVVQMIVGVFLSLLNHLYFDDKILVWYRFIPEIVFLLCTFGYMCVLIVVKWCTNWDNRTHNAPSLLETMTNFFLQPGTVTVPLYSGQEQVQLALFLIAFAMVPLLLCAIPIHKKREHERRQRMMQHVNADPSLGEDEEEFDFSEVVIHQVIHTIEYVLGCVSNTASYLRLWALSLAHSQLSEVFWSFTFLMAVDMDGGSGICIFVGLCVWMCATLAVLLGMESLSAFLHALRLHWVEFNNKFYAADGYPFTPFNIAEVLNKLN